MGLTYYDDLKRPKSRLANALIAVNGVLAFCMAFYWSGAAGVLGEPFRWAMRSGVSLNPSLFEYPYLTLWLVPMLCMFGGWLALKGDRIVVSRIIGGYPISILILIVGWYYLAPQHWH